MPPVAAAPPPTGAAPSRHTPSRCCAWCGAEAPAGSRSRFKKCSACRQVRACCGPTAIGAAAAVAQPLPHCALVGGTFSTPAQPPACPQTLPRCGTARKTVRYSTIGQRAATGTSARPCSCSMARRGQWRRQARAAAACDARSRPSAFPAFSCSFLNSFRCLMCVHAVASLYAQTEPADLQSGGPSEVCPFSFHSAGPACCACYAGQEHARPQALSAKL